MTAHARFPNRGARKKRTLGVQQALEWAFRTEKVRLELPEPPDPERGEGLGVIIIAMTRTGSERARMPQSDAYYGCRRASLI